MALKPRSPNGSGRAEHIFLSRNSHAEDAHFLQSRFPRRHSEGPGRTYYDDKVACRADVVERVRERVRRLYVARISNKLSADPLARSFIMTSTRLPGRVWTRYHQRVRACVRSTHFMRFRDEYARVRANVDASCKKRCY